MLLSDHSPKSRFSPFSVGLLVLVALVILELPSTVNSQWCIPGKVPKGGLQNCVGDFLNSTTYIKENKNGTWEFPISYEKVYDYSVLTAPIMCSTITGVDCSSCLSGSGSVICNGCPTFMSSDRCRALGSRCSKVSPDCLCRPTKVSVEHTWVTQTGQAKLVSIGLISEPLLKKPPGRTLTAYDINPKEFNSTICPKCEGSVDWCNKNWIPLCKPGNSVGRRLLSDSPSIPWGTDTISVSLLQDSVTVSVAGTAQTSTYSCVISLSTLPPFTLVADGFGDTSRSYPVSFASASGIITARLFSPTGLLIGTYYKDNFVAVVVTYPDSYTSTTWITGFNHWDMPHKLGVMVVVLLSIVLMIWIVKLTINVCVSCDNCVRTRFCKKYFCCGSKEEEKVDLLDEKKKMSREESARMAAVLRAALAAVMVSGSDFSLGVDACDNGLFVPSSFSQCRSQGNCTGMFSALATIPAFGSSFCIGVRDPITSSPLGELRTEMVSMTQEHVYKYSYVTAAWTVVSQQYVNPYSTNDGLGQESYRCHMAYCNIDGRACTTSFDPSSLPMCDGWVTYSPGNTVYWGPAVLLNAKCISTTRACFPQPVKDGRLLVYPGKNLGTTIATDNTGRHLMWVRYTLVWNTASVVQEYDFTNYVGRFRVYYRDASGHEQTLFLGDAGVNDIIQAGDYSLTLSGYIPSLTASDSPPKYLLYSDIGFTYLLSVGDSDGFSPPNNPVSGLIGDVQLPVNAYSDVNNMIWASNLVDSTVDLFGYRVSSVRSAMSLRPPGVKLLQETNYYPYRVSSTSSSLASFGASFPFATLWQVVTVKPVTLTRTVVNVCPFVDDQFTSGWSGEWSSIKGCSMYVRAKTSSTCDTGMVSVKSTGNMTLFTVSLTIDSEYKTFEIRGFCPDVSVPEGKITLIGSGSSVEIKYGRTDLSEPAIFANGSANYAFVNMTVVWNQYYGSSSSGWSWGGVGSGVASIFGSLGSGLASLSNSLGLDKLFGGSGIGSIISQIVTIVIYVLLCYGLYLLVMFLYKFEKARRSSVKYAVLVDEVDQKPMSPDVKTESVEFEPLVDTPEIKESASQSLPPWLRPKPIPSEKITSKPANNQRYTSNVRLV